jgi:hypothetical protein
MFMARNIILKIILGGRVHFIFGGGGRALHRPYQNTLAETLRSITFLTV